jgi:hypothetical protein
MLCDYGCGKESKYQFKNGKWCCSKNHSQCPAVSKKIKNSNLGKVFSEERKKNISKSLVGHIPWNKGKVTGQNNWLDKKHTEESKSKMSKSRYRYFEKLTKQDKINIYGRPITIKYINNKYLLFSKVEEMRYNPDKPDEIQVHCKNHLCSNSKEQGGWFTPTGSQFDGRRRALEDSNGTGGGYFYCCDECKEECPLYNKRVIQLINEDKIKAGHIKEELYISGEYQTWRNEVLKRANYLCEYCEEHATDSHHSRPQKLEPGFALDPDFGIACCEKCHYKYGHKDECSTGNLATIICKEK